MRLGVGVSVKCQAVLVFSSFASCEVGTGQLYRGRSVDTRRKVPEKKEPESKPLEEKGITNSLPNPAGKVKTFDMTRLLAVLIPPDPVSYQMLTSSTVFTS